jgi:hypothetical protein
MVGKEVSKKQVVGKVLQIMMILSVLILAVLFLYSQKICIKVGGVGNIFFLLWIIFADPLKSGISFRSSDKSFSELLICAILIWVFAYMFNYYGLCGGFSEMANIFGKYF